MKSHCTGLQTGREGFVAGVLVLGLFGFLVLFVYLFLLPTFNHSLPWAEFLTKSVFGCHENVPGRPSITGT